MQASVTVPMAAPAERDLEHRRRRPQHRQVLARGDRGRMAGRRHRSRARARVPRACAAQRDRPGLLDDLPGHRVRTGTRVRLRGAPRRPPREQLALPVHPVDGGTDVTESFRMNDRLVHQAVRGVGRPTPKPAQHPRHAQDAGADQGRRRELSRRLGLNPIPKIGIHRPNSQMPHWWKPSSHTGFTS